MATLFRTSQQVPKLRIVLCLLVAAFISCSCTAGLLPEATSTVEEAIYAAALSPDGSNLAVSDDRGLHLYRIDTFQEVWSSPSDNPAWRLAFSPDGTRLASIASGKATLWDAQSGKRLRTLTWDAQPVDLEFSPDGSMLALADGSYVVTVWDAEMDEVISTTHMEVEGFRSGPVDVWSVAWSPNDTTLAAVLVGPPGDNNGMAVWDAETGERLRVSQGYTCVDSLVFSPNGTMVASRLVGEVAVWDVQKGEQLHILESAPPVSSLVWLRNGDVLVLGTSSGIASMWDAKTGERQRTFKVLADAILLDGLALLPDGTTIVSASKHEIVVWDIRTGERLRTLERQ
jgi:WD40 repeat protein